MNKFQSPEAVSPAYAASPPKRKLMERKIEVKGNARAVARRERGIDSMHRRETASDRLKKLEK